MAEDYHCETLLMLDDADYQGRVQSTQDVYGEDIQSSKAGGRLSWLGGMREGGVRSMADMYSSVPR